MKLALITAGAAGMYCGSCMRDNTLAAALIARGHDALLVPTYTPIRTDEQDVSQSRVFFGGVNVFLQQKFALFRHTPWLMDRILDVPRLLRWVSRFAVKTDASTLGGLTISMLEGEQGLQKKEVAKLADWLENDIKPELISLTNVLLSGVVRELKRRLQVPIIASLQGDDIFLEALPERDRKRCLDLIRRNCQSIDGFIATSGYYADFMAGYLGIERSRIEVVLPGIDLRGHGGEHVTRTEPPYTIGYFARICPEKGFHQLVEAFIRLRQTPGAPMCQLKVSGWLGENNRHYYHEQVKRLEAEGLATDFHHVESPSHEDKVRFLQSIDVLSVPTTYHEPKGLYILEALANGVPVVQPRHGSFPELVTATGGGVLVNPDDPVDLAQGIQNLLTDHALRQKLGHGGREVVWRDFTAAEMARRTETIFDRFVKESVMRENSQTR